VSGVVSSTPPISNTTARMVIPACLTPSGVQCA
jgi:hypothetical protein